MFVFCAININAQGFERRYVNAEIYFKNHESVKGYIYDDFIQDASNHDYDFQQNGGWSANGVSFGYQTSTSFQTIIKTIYFKQNLNDGQQIEYKSDSIDYITIHRNGNSQKYKTLNVLRAQWNVENVGFDTLNKTIWSPVLKEGKINMYGYFTWRDRIGDGWAEVHFQRNDEKYAINPILSHKLTGLNAQRPQIKASLLKVFHDCPKFKENIETIIDEYIEDFHAARKLSKEEKASLKKKPKDLRDREEFIIREKRSFVPYENILNKYYAYCGQ